MHGPFGPPPHPPLSSQPVPPVLPPVPPAAKNRVCPLSHEIRKNRIRAGPRVLSIGNGLSRPSSQDAHRFVGPDGKYIFLSGLEKSENVFFQDALEKTTTRVSHLRKCAFGAIIMNTTLLILLLLLFVVIETTCSILHVALLYRNLIILHSKCSGVKIVKRQSCCYNYGIS